MTSMLKQLTPQEAARLMIAQAHVTLISTIPLSVELKGMSDVLPSLRDDTLIVKLAENGARNTNPPECSRCEHWSFAYIDAGYGTVGDCSQLSSGVYGVPVLVVGADPDYRPPMRTRGRFCCNRFTEKAND